MTASELIDIVTRLEKAQGEFDTEEILTHVNSALRDITVHSRSIRGEILIEAVKGQRQYGLTPKNVLSIAAVMFKFPGDAFPSA